MYLRLPMRVLWIPHQMRPQVRQVSGTLHGSCSCVGSRSASRVLCSGLVPPRPHHFLMCLPINSCASHGIAIYLLCHVLLPQTSSSLSSMAVLLAGPCGSCLLGLCVVCRALLLLQLLPMELTTHLRFSLTRQLLPFWPLPYPCAFGHIAFDPPQLLLTLATSQGLVIWCSCPSSP